MNPNFDRILAAENGDKVELFEETATGLGTLPAHVEKDFWVCWTLDHLFNGRNAGAPRLLFKGGTSLSKSFGLINRFSEDIDVTVFRTDIDHGISVAELREMGRKPRERKLDQIRDDCSVYIRETLKDQFEAMVDSAMSRNQVAKPWKVEVDPNDPDNQSLLFWYPSAFAASGNDEYVRRAVLIESGAKSALEPHVTSSVKPYLADVMGDVDLTVQGITTADPKRTFWDKVVVAHGQHQWFVNRGEIKGGGERVSRHYYDLFKLFGADVGPTALQDLPLGEDVVQHASMFFNRKPYNLELAVPGSFTLVPPAEMMGALEKDYDRMAGMIFGDVPSFKDVMSSIKEIEDQVNSGGPD